MKNAPGRLAGALALVACPALLLVGCDEGAPAAPAGPTAGEEQAIEDAATMLDERPDDVAPPPEAPAR